MSRQTDNTHRVAGHESIARRAAQLLFLALFLIGPIIGFWLVKGTLAASMTLDFLPLTDPLITLQAFVAGHVLETEGLIGAALVLVIYALIGGRMYCSWACPVNILSDTAIWLRRRIGWKGTGVRVNRRARLWILGAVLVVSAATGTVAWEFVNPITIIHRSLVFGTLFGAGLAWMVVAAMFLIELVGGSRLWCSHLCPVGAFYGLIGKFSILRVSANRRDACDDCLDCYVVCPEMHVINPALKGEKHGRGPIIMSSDCTNCGRCIDVCPETVFTFSSRFRNRPEDVVPVEPEARAPKKKAA